MSLLCTTLSLVLGLYFSRNNIAISIIISLAYLIFLFIRFNKKTFIVSLVLFMVGTGLSYLNLEYNSNSNDYSGVVVESKKNYIIVQSHYEKFYVYEQENTYEVGDYLIINGSPEEVKFTTYESQFNFKEYLQNKGIKREIKVNIIDTKYHSLLKIKALKRKFLANFNENTAGLINAFLFNEKDYENTAIKLSSDLNISFLFSMSGVYLHLMFAGLTYLLSIKCSDKVSEILPFLILLPYAFFSLSKVGTLRVYLTYLISYLNKHYFKKKLTHVEVVSTLALIFIIFDYHLVYQEAFYIGFLLSTLSSFLNNAYSLFFPRKRKILMPFSFFALLIPSIIGNSGKLKLLTYLITSIITFPNLVFIILSIVSTIIPFYGIVNGFGNVITWILEKMELINFSIPISDLGGTFGILFCFLILLGIYYLESYRIKHFKITLCCVISLVLIAIVPLQDPLVNAVYFINVGQGDSILIKNRNKTVMIDTGGYKGCDMATDTLIPFLNKNKITHIDTLILTHDDFDHSGAKESLINNFKVYNVLDSKEQFPYKVGNLNFQNLNTLDTNEDNDNSLVISLNFMNKKWLFMGDASTIVEKDLLSKGIDIDCDILKVGHHGSKYSTSDAFLKATTPKEAIISVGAKNYYGHPSNEVIDLLVSNNVKIRRTDLEGTISYLSLIA